MAPRGRLTGNFQVGGELEYLPRRRHSGGAASAASIGSSAASFAPATLTNATLSNGNLRVTSPGYVNGATSSVSHSSGKWYFEVTLTSIGTTPAFGVIGVTGTAAPGYPANSGVTEGWEQGIFGVTCSCSAGHIYDATFDSALLIGALHSGDVVGVAVDMVNLNVWFKVVAGPDAAGALWNGQATGNPATNTQAVGLPSSATTTQPFFGFGSNSNTDNITVNFGASAFSGAIPAGFSAWSASATWDQPNMVTRSGGNLTITNIGSVYQFGQGALVASTSSKSSGKYYFEMTIATIDTNDQTWGSSCFGVAVAVTSGFLTALTNLSTHGVGGVIYNAGAGVIYSNGASNAAFIGIVLQGDVIGVAVDLDHRNIWYKPVAGSNAGSYNWNDGIPSGDPVANTGGIAILAGTLVPYAVFAVANTNDSMIANFGASGFSGPVPSGFIAGWPQ